MNAGEPSTAAPLKPTGVIFAVLVFTALTAQAEVRPCGDVGPPLGVQASDALRVLKKSVGTDVELTCGCTTPAYDLHAFDFFKILGSDRSDYLDLSHADLTSADFHGLDTFHANFNGAILQNANLSNTSWSESNFNGAILQNANLSNSSWQNSNFNGTNLRAADLRGAQFSNRVNFMAADLREADLRGAKISSTIFLGANLDGALLEGVVWGSSVICPDGLAGPCTP